MPFPPFQALADNYGAMNTIPLTDTGRIDLEALEQRQGRECRLVALSMVSNVLGVVHPIKAITAGASPWRKVRRRRRTGGGASSVDVADLRSMPLSFLVHTRSWTHGCRRTLGHP